MYGMQLSAYGSRIVAARIAFDTDAGWFTVDVPSTPLHERDLHYSGPWSTFTREGWFSPVMYASFPSPVKIVHGWISQARAWKSAPFDWERRGPVTCRPSPPDPIVRTPRMPRGFTLDPKDRDDLSALPNEGSSIIAAQRSQALKATNCSEPFKPPSVTKQSSPDFPRILGGSFTGAATAAAEVAINADGSVADASIWGPSGLAAFDDATLAAARASTYKPGSAYCSPVPGNYLFIVTFHNP